MRTDVIILLNCLSKAYLLQNNNGHDEISTDANVTYKNTNVEETNVTPKNTTVDDDNFYAILFGTSFMVAILFTVGIIIVCLRIRRNWHRSATYNIQRAVLATHVTEEIGASSPRPVKKLAARATYRENLDLIAVQKKNMSLQIKPRKKILNPAPKSPRTKRKVKP
jgi:hypothetical protein